MHIGRLTQRTIDHAGTNSCIGETVNQHECARHAVIRIRIKYNLIRRLKMAEANLVQIQLCDVFLRERVDVSAVLDLADRDRCLVRFGTQEIGTARQQSLFAKPDHIRAETVGHFWACLSSHKHVTARDLDLVFENQSYRLPFGSTR